MKQKYAIENLVIANLATLKDNDDLGELDGKVFILTDESNNNTNSFHFKEILSGLEIFIANENSTLYVKDFLYPYNITDIPTSFFTDEELETGYIKKFRVITLFAELNNKYYEDEINFSIERKNTNKCFKQ